MAITVVPLDLGVVELPDWHPPAADRTCLIQGFAVQHPDGSHLHFDHCGQNRFLPWVPVWVQSAEYEMVDAPRYTISEWATTPIERLRLIDGDADLAEGVRILSTPGHTPGHQSLLVQSDGVTTVIGGQCCYTCAEFTAGSQMVEDVHDESWLAQGRASIERLQSFDPDVVHLSHDPRAVRR